MPVIDVRNIPTVVEFAPEHTVVEFTEDSVTAQVMVGPTVVEFSWGELVPGPGLKGGGVFQGTVPIDQDIPGLPPLPADQVDPAADLLMLWDESSQQHVKVYADIGGGLAEIPWATREETDAGVLTDKALNPDVGAYAYDRFRHAGQHTAGKGTETVILTPDTGVVTVDGNLSNVFRLVLNGDVTFANPVNPINGQTINIHLKQDVAGGHAVTSWGSQWKFVNRINPVLSTAPNAIDLLSCQWNEIDGIMECSFLPNYGSGYTEPPPPTAADLVFVNVGAGNNIYRDTEGLNVNLRTIVGSGDIVVGTEGDTIVVSYTAPIAVDYSQVPFLISGDITEYPSLPYARQIVAGAGIVIDTATEGQMSIASDLQPIPPGGTTAQVLTKLSDDEFDVGWVTAATGSFDSPTTTKGDLIVRNATADVRLAAGTPGQALVVDPTTDTGLKWGDVGGGGGSELIIAQGSPVSWARQAANQSVVSSTTYVSTDLSRPLEAGKTYLVRIGITCLGLTTSWLNLRVNYTGTVTAIRGAWQVSRLAASTSQFTDWITALPNVMSVGTTADHSAFWEFVITPATNGTLSLDMAQNASSATPVTVYANSWMRVEQILDTPGSISGAVVTRAAAQSCSSGATVIASWDTEVRDDEGYWSNVNPTRITIPVSGWYSVVAAISQLTNGVDLYAVSIRKNGAVFSSTDFQQRLGNGTSISAYVQAAAVDYYDAGDYLEVIVVSRSGSFTFAGRLGIVRIGGATGPTGASGVSSGVGSLTLVGTATVTGAAATALTVSGLDLDAHGGLYQIEIIGDNGSGSTANMSLYFNGDTAAANYFEERVATSAGSVSGTGGNDAIVSNPTTTQSFSLTGSLRRDFDGFARMNFASSRGLPSGRITNTGWLMYNVVANVTSITLSSSVASALSVGTTINVYRVVAATVENKSAGSDLNKTADTTLAADPTLQATLAANKKYRIEMDVYWDTNATADLKFDLDFTGTTASVFWTVENRSGATASLPTIVQSGTPQSFACSALNTLFAFNVTANTTLWERIVVDIHTGASGGLFSLRWAQSVASGTSTRRRNSYMKVQECA